MLKFDNFEMVVYPERSGYVYLAKSVDSDNFRIGFTKDLTTRKKQLRAYNQSSLNIVKYFYTPNPRLDKQKLCEFFCGYHKHNDWYEVYDFDTFEKMEIKYFSSHTWNLARKDAVKTLEGLGVKNDPVFQHVLSRFINPMREVGTVTELKKLDYSLNKIREYILEKGEPQEVAMSFLSYPKVWDTSYANCPWAGVPSCTDILRSLAELAQILEKMSEMLDSPSSRAV